MPGSTFFMEDKLGKEVVLWHIFHQSIDSSDHYKLPFGQFYCEPDIGKPTLRSFTKSLINELKNQGIKELSSFLAPVCYDESGVKKLSSVLKALANSQCIEVNQHISLVQTNFYDGLSRSFKAKIGKLKNLNWKFQQQPPDQLGKSYDLISNSMGRKQFPVTMSLKHLQKAFNNFPKSYYLFTVIENDVLIASAISVRINEDIIYNIFHSDAESHRKLSPTIFLIAGIFEFAQKANFRILDLGTSTVNGILNEGLFTFKKKLGAISTEKGKYLIDLSNV